MLCRGTTSTLFSILLALPDLHHISRDSCRQSLLEPAMSSVVLKKEDRRKMGADDHLHLLFQETQLTGRWNSQKSKTLLASHRCTRHLQHNVSGVKPKCHFPDIIVKYPLSCNNSAIVTTRLFKCIVRVSDWEELLGTFLRI